MTTSITATVDLGTTGVDAATSGGDRIVMAADPPEGDGSAPSAKETLLAALAGCTGMDVASILRKKRQVATAYEIAVSGESADEHPKVFTSITVEHRIRGEVEAEALRRSIELSATRYCPINAMLSAVARVEHRYLLIDVHGATSAATVAVVGPDRQIQVMA
ncbi:MAG: OsmC family protein [Candidatus Limnocylindria bacterium]